MPRTINGIGTRYYGRRDQEADGSYITTEWITLLYLPLIPFRSFRVLPMGEGKNYILHRSQRYQVARVPLSWKQVLRTYLIAGAIILALFSLFALLVANSR